MMMMMEQTQTKRQDKTGGVIFATESIKQTRTRMDRRNDEHHSKQNETKISDQLELAQLPTTTVASSLPWF